MPYIVIDEERCKRVRVVHHRVPEEAGCLK